MLEPKKLQPNQLFGLLLSTVGEKIRSQLMGRILTLVEVSMPESTQLTALKDLLRQEINYCDTEVWRDLNQFARDIEIKNLYGEHTDRPVSPVV